MNRRWGWRELEARSLCSILGLSESQTQPCRSKPQRKVIPLQPVPQVRRPVRTEGQKYEQANRDCRLEQSSDSEATVFRSLRLIPFAPPSRSLPGPHPPLSTTTSMAVSPTRPSTACPLPTAAGFVTSMGACTLPSPTQCESRRLLHANWWRRGVQERTESEKVPLCL